MALSCFFVNFCEQKSLHVSVLKCDFSYRVRIGLTNLNIGVTHLLFETMSWEMMNFSDWFNSLMSDYSVHKKSLEKKIFEILAKKES